MGLRLGSWKTVTVAKDGTSSSETDLGENFRNVQVYTPAIDSATLTVKVSRNTGDTAVQVYAWDADATGNFVHTTTARATAGMEVFKDICARYVTLVLSAAQTTAARTFYVRGIDPL